MTTKKGKIEITENGPYKVSWSVPLDEESYIPDENWASLDYKKEKDFPLQEEYFLCRCWKSKNKPFCDSTHLKIEFDWTETANNEKYLDKVELYEWQEVDLLDCEEFCAGARFCDAYNRAWQMVINPQNEKETELAIGEAIKCPGWRLTIKTKDWKLVDPELEEWITALNDPSLWVRWPLKIKWKIPIISLNWKIYEIRNRVTLCRCWKSQNKPFCDWSHIQDKYEWDWI